MSKRLKVLFLAAEAVPFVKVGGLGDVAGTLPRALRALKGGPDIRMVLPLHPQVDRDKLNLKPAAAFSVGHVDGSLRVQAFETEVDGLPVYFIDGGPIAEAASVYSSDSRADGYKYVLFSMGALEMARILDWQPDIVHAQDWHTAAAIYYIKLNRKYDAFYKKCRTLLTVHNLPYLGNEAGPVMQDFGLPAAVESGLPEWSQQMPLPLGLYAADKINSVSPGYAGEMLTPEFGSGLYAYLAGRKKDLVGILNGLDEDSWDPKTDEKIPVNFNRDSLVERKENKRQLQDELNLAVNPRIPLLSIISRMDHQKGIDTAIEGLRLAAGLPWRVVILGTGTPEIEEQARQLGRDYPDKVRTMIRYDEGLARRIYAGSDAILIPSRYEPCGLTQMIGMRYGCVPIARATGGLKDTIVDFEDSEENTGFLFAEGSAEALAETIERALGLFLNDQRRWRGLQLRGMAQDFSWMRSAKEYLTLYQSMMAEKLRR